MKRKLFILMLVFLFSGIKINATNNSYDSRINLIDMRNIYFENANISNHSSSHYVKTKEPLTLKEFSTYTIIADERYFQRDLEEGYPLEMWTFHGGEIGVIPQHFVSLEYGNWVYVTFEVDEVLFNIDKMTINDYLDDDPEYPFKIMMFEGTINDFQGFYGYGSSFDYMEEYLLLGYGNEYTFEQIQNLIINESGEIQLLETNYVAGSTVGDYYLKFQAKTPFDVTSSYKLNVKVVDITPPVIKGNSSSTYEAYGPALSSNQIQSILTVTDDVDGNIPWQNLVVLEDTFINKKNVPGTYHITFEAKDSANNRSTFTHTITITDTTPPTIKGPSVFYRDISEGLMSTEEILTLFTATDLVDGPVAVTLKTPPHTVASGKHLIEVEAKDSFNNAKTAKLYLVYIDNSLPNIISSPLVISKSEFENMTEEEIKAWIIENTGGENIVILNNEASFDSEGKVYFSYDLNGKTHYGIIEVKTKKNIIPFIIVGSVIVLNGIGLFIYFKKKKF
ncbi:MAG: hypothetical protein GX931_02740 [Acholeplasmataceae bacterium]|nr:hypothetical protein [Acholeplasmataceae bacterium]